MNFSDATTAVDADFARVSSLETITLSNNTNSVTLASEADATGIATITGGTGIDTIDTSDVDFDNAITITGGDEADNITLGTETATVKFTSTTAVLMALEANVDDGVDQDFSATVGDSVDGFTSGTDTLNFDAALVTNAIGTETDTLLSIAAGGTVTNADRFVEITGAITNGEQMGSVITILNALTTTAVAIGDSFLAFTDDGTDGYVYLVQQVSTADTIVAQDVTLVGQITGVTDIANGDFVSF